MDQKFRPLHVLEELVPQPAPGVCSLDQPGNVGNHELMVVTCPHESQVGVFRGEGIVGDLGVRPRKPAQEGRLAGIRLADEPHVGNQLQFERDSSRLPRFAPLELPGGPVGGRGEMLVAVPSPAAAGNHERLAVPGEVAQQKAAVRIENQRAGRDADDHVLAPLARH